MADLTNAEQLAREICAAIVSDIIIIVYLSQSTNYSLLGHCSQVASLGRCNYRPRIINLLDFRKYQLNCSCTHFLGLSMDTGGQYSANENNLSALSIP